MVKNVSIGFVLLLLVSSADAATYRCRDAAGNIVFTDAPSTYSAGCEQVILRETSTIPVVLPDNQSTPSPPETMEQPAADAVPAPDQGVAEEDFAFYVGQATALVAEFKETQQKVLQTQFHRDKVAARRNLSDIRQRKMQLLEKAATPAFSAAENETIKGILAEITEGD